MPFDIVFFPNCDIHVALNGTPPLRIEVLARQYSKMKDPNGKEIKDLTSYTLEENVTPSCSFDFFAPYNDVGKRLETFVDINPNNGSVTPKKLGTNLVQVRYGDFYIIIRIQVHEKVLGWWFGNSSITTALDKKIAHSQPSIYALFSDDSTGTELVGDITGHDYVFLSSSDPSVFTVGTQQRLQGLQEGKARLNGQFLNISYSLPVDVVDYGKSSILEAVAVPSQVGEKQSIENMHNILFIPEGFRDTAADKEQFNKIVTKVVHEMFTKPRHEPYGLLKDSFNVWKAFHPSKENLVTCGYRVNDREGQNILSKGFPIPYNGLVSETSEIYTIQELVKIVGLPLRKENRDLKNLKNLWESQSLKRFDPASKLWIDKFDSKKINDVLISAWKLQQSVGILEARDTFFGLYLGARNGDRTSDNNPISVLPPKSDIVSDDKLAPFIERVYEWFNTKETRLLTPDSRRHPPNLSLIGNSIFKYISNLRTSENVHIGTEWIPDENFKKSVGLIVLITNDNLNGGTNIGMKITANTLADRLIVELQPVNSTNDKIMRRISPDSIDEDIDDIIDTVTHELGHSFNLADEYETFSQDVPDWDKKSDNITALKTIKLNDDYNNKNVLSSYRKINPSNIKWFDLPRIRLSNTLVKNSETENGQIKVSIDKHFIGQWIEAKKQNAEVSLRKTDIRPDGQQLPLKVEKGNPIGRLIIGVIDEPNGTILLGGPRLPSEPLPIFPKGSLLFIPKRDALSNLVYVVEKKVLQNLTLTNLPLNKDTDTIKVNNEPDYPVDIPDFKPPCKSYKLVGIYEGAATYTGMLYRPSGLCKMRTQSDSSKVDGNGEFCYVCKYLIVNRVNPSLHGLLDKKHYPEAKNG
jgi:IgA Peptidase M64